MKNKTIFFKKWLSTGCQDARETKIRFKNWVVWEIRGKITLFD